MKTKYIKILILFLLSFLILFSCGQPDPNMQIDEGKVTGEIYQSKEIGWTIEIPRGWKIISKDKVEAMNKKGEIVLEKTAGQQIDIKHLKQLINFQKDPFNIFMSTSEPFVEEYPGEYHDNDKKIYQLLYNTFVDQEIRVDTSSGKEVIQTLEFNTFYTTIYSPKGEIIMNQILYSKLINGLSFGVTICYNNLSDKNTLLTTWKNSLFNK